MLEENLAVAEGREVAVAFATGMAAVSAALGILTSAGDQMVAHRALYGCTPSLMTSWLPRYKIHTDFCDLTGAESRARHNRGPAGRAGGDLTQRTVFT
jgi:methionine-gamma-lyase